MIIKNITIENFRSYYGVNSIEIGKSLTLIIGANGDGKTTFFEALEWLFDTAGALPKVDNKYISKKKCAEIQPNEFASVKVSMSYENEGDERIVQKSFKFTKSLNGEISTSNYIHEIYLQSGVEKDVRQGDSAVKLFDYDFASSIRKYCLFKGEHELNIFNKEEAMSYLVETFSQVRNFDPYLNLMEESKKWAEVATDNAIKADKKNSTEAERLRSSITLEEQRLRELENELENKLSEATNFQKLLEDIENNKEASSELVDINNRLENLKRTKEGLKKSINENYTFRLLDDMWILMGFLPIAEEYKNLVAKLDKEQRKQQSLYDQEVGARKLAAQMQKELDSGQIPLALNIPDENTMREMIDDEFCKVCGRPAPKGSDAYNFMKSRLEKFLASQESDEPQEEDIVPLFVNSFIRELNDKYSVLHNNVGRLHKLNGNIDTEIRNNLKKHNEIEKYSSNIEQDEERKKQILAHTDGLTEEQLVSVYRDISEWWKGQREAERRSDILKLEVDKHRNLLNTYQENYAKISEDSSAAMYSRSSQAIRKILEAFKDAKKRNKEEFLYQLGEAANEYLALLNKDDFRGTVHIKPLHNNSAEIILEDMDGTRVYNPNTALKTTMYMSLLFAVAKLTTIKHENDYPLIFDAPTSSFTGAKESDFFSVIAGINKQTIVVTKSFLIEDEDGNSKLDRPRLDEIDAKKYRISKKRPFNDKDLSTIQTIVETI